ncbi:tryptophan 2,3-dioxygenase family protein (plasmid) [Micromonospora zamorensis]|uniref:tryptophan 2,3-dioxygenase family protein n=1 Tax=Micromonospora zamorensis TaxID=709883 RepID=UPI002E1F83E3
MRDYSQPILAGRGATDYGRYMRVDDLLALQRHPSEMVHRDELLFQVVHQVTELWLKLACYDAAEAVDQMRAGDPALAEMLLARAARVISLITDELDMLRRLAPADFQLIRTVLGNGSGFESPGWRRVQRTSRDLGNVFADLLARRDVKLVDLYRGSPTQPLYRLAEALLDWDERISSWRVQHYQIATRTIGHNVVGTKGTPVDALAKLISHHFFPALWQVRTELTETGPMAWDDSASCQR